MFQHNRQLQKFIASADQKVASATKPQDLLDIIEETRAFHGNFRFDPRDYLLYFGLDMIALLIGIFAFRKSDEGFWLFVIFLSLFVGIILLVRYFKRRNHVDQLSERIYRRDLLFDNHLEVIHSPNFSQKALEARFSDFHRGNYSREIREVIQGENLQDYPFSYHYYHFHYVDQREETSTDSDGKTTTKTHYSHYDRYGLIIDLQSISHMTEIPLLKILQSKAFIGMNKGDYAPASITFRKHFKVQTNDPQQAAKFLTPVMVETIESMQAIFRKVVIETNSHSELLLSFDNPEVFASNRQYSLRETDLFLQEISQTTPLPNLIYTLNIIGKMLQEMDHNF